MKQSEKLLEETKQQQSISMATAPRQSCHKTTSQNLSVTLKVKLKERRHSVTVYD